MVSKWPSKPRVPERVDGGRTRLGEWLARVRTGGRCCGLVRVSVAPYSKVSRADPEPLLNAQAKSLGLELYYNYSMAKQVSFG